MKKRIAVVGAGAVGGYLGGHLARTGNDVTLIDPWPEHVEAIRKHGLKLSGMTDEESLHGQRSDHAPHRGAVALESSGRSTSRSSPASPTTPNGRRR